MTRITQQGRTAGINADLQLAGSRLSKIQRQVASGRQIERPSDAPAVALEALRYRRTLRTYGQYDRNLDDIFTVQDEITNIIVATLAGRIERLELRRAA